MKVCSDTDIHRREERREACPQDFENTLELAWYYIQKDRMEDATALIQQLDQESIELYGEMALAFREQGQLQLFHSVTVIVTAKCQIHKIPLTGPGHAS